MTSPQHHLITIIPCPWKTTWIFAPPPPAPPKQSPQTPSVQHVQVVRSDHPVSAAESFELATGTGYLHFFCIMHNLVCQLRWQAVDITGDFGSREPKGRGSCGSSGSWVEDVVGCGRHARTASFLSTIA